MASTPRRRTIRALCMLPPILCAGPFATAAESATVIRGAMLFDGTGKAPYAADLLIEGDRIAAIGDDLSAPSGTTEVEANGRALIPGLFDLHVHWTPGGEPATHPEIAEQYVIHGVTTVTDFHSPPESYAPKRAWLEKLSAPHVAFAARMSTPGGHGAMWADDHTTYKISTPEDAQVAMDHLAPYEPDLIKLFADGWRYGRKEENTSMDELTIGGMVEAAAPHDLPVVGHVVTVDRAKKAARAGMDVLVHALQDGDADDELVELMVSHGTVYSPSLAVYEITPEKRGFYGEEGLARAEARHAHSMHNLKAFHGAGVPVAVGTDAGMPRTPHGRSTLRELELLVDGGLTPAEALVAGTHDSAAALHVLDDRGTLEVGKRADLVLIEGRPWETISDVRNVSAVWIDGELLAKDGALTREQPRGLPAAVPAQALIDDFESEVGRSALGTVYVDHRDSGVGHSASLSQRVPRLEGQGHAYAMQAHMANRKDPEASVRIHFTPGAVVPVDASSFDGVRLALRGDGDGDYFVGLYAPGSRCKVPVNAQPEWTTVSVPFSDFCEDGELDPAQLLMFEAGRWGEAGGNVWMEIDDVAFY